jgi:hypothetical protein
MNVHNKLEFLQQTLTMYFQPCLKVLGKLESTARKHSSLFCRSVSDECMKCFLTLAPGFQPIRSSHSTAPPKSFENEEFEEIGADKLAPFNKATILLNFYLKTLLPFHVNKLECSSTTNIKKSFYALKLYLQPGNVDRNGRVSTVDLLIITGLVLFQYYINKYFLFS